jgi:hypothetical protein
MCTLVRARLLSTIGASALMALAAMLATDFVGVEEDPFQ